MRETKDNGTKISTILGESTDDETKICSRFALLLPAQITTTTADLLTFLNSYHFCGLEMFYYSFEQHEFS